MLATAVPTSDELDPREARPLVLLLVAELADGAPPDMVVPITLEAPEGRAPNMLVPEVELAGGASSLVCPASEQPVPMEPPKKKTTAQSGALSGANAHAGPSKQFATSWDAA